MNIKNLKIGQSFVFATENWKEKKVKNPKTGNMVKVKSLPPEIQKKYKPKEKIKKSTKKSKSKIKIVDDKTKESYKSAIEKWSGRHVSKGKRGDTPHGVGNIKVRDDGVVSLAVDFGSASDKKRKLMVKELKTLFPDSDISFTSPAKSGDITLSSRSIEIKPKGYDDQIKEYRKKATKEYKNALRDVVGLRPDRYERAEHEKMSKLKDATPEDLDAAIKKEEERSIKDHSYLSQLKKVKEDSSYLEKALDSYKRNEDDYKEALKKATELSPYPKESRHQMFEDLKKIKI